MPPSQYLWEIVALTWFLKCQKRDYTLNGEGFQLKLPLNLSRSMELNCKRDINSMYLLEGKPVPGHATFARFKSIHFSPCVKRILAEMPNLLYGLGEASGETIFIDGTGVWHISNQKSTSKSCNRLIFLSTFLFCYLVIFSDVWYTDNRGDNRAGDNI